MIFPPLTVANPLPGFNFAVAFADTQQMSAALASGGVLSTVAGFQEVTGLESTIEMKDYKEGGRNDFTHKFATSVSFGNITFKRGVSQVPDLWTWYNTVRQGSFGARRTIVITHLDYEGKPALIWTVSRALPAKYVGAAWNAGQSSVAIESLEVCHEGLSLVPGSDYGAGGVVPRS